MTFALVFAFGYLLGSIPFGLVLTRLAEWARDESAQRMLNVTVWLLPLSVGILMLLPLITVMRFFTCMAALMWLTSLVTFGLAMLSLAMSAAWSVKHARDRIHRDTELRKRIVRRPPPPPPSDEPIRLAEPGDPMPEIGLVGHADVVITTMDDIVRDVACASCGYNLRGLKVSGKCPECGERIASA